MGEDAGPARPLTAEAEFAHLVKYVDLYLRQKTDLFLQHYLFEPVDFLGQKVMYLTIVVALLAAGTLILVAGVIFFIATLVPFWAALLISGFLTFLAGGLVAYLFFHKQIVLQTPTAREMMDRGKE